VEKASGSLSVICKRATYQDSAGVFASEFQAMTCRRFADSVHRVT
jgi:hypothetical protein